MNLADWNISNAKTLKGMFLRALNFDSDLTTWLPVKNGNIESLIDFVRSKLLDFMDDAQSLDCNRTDDDDETKQKTLVESKTINVELSVVN